MFDLQQSLSEFIQIGSIPALYFLSLPRLIQILLVAILVLGLLPVRRYRRWRERAKQKRHARFIKSSHAALAKVEQIEPWYGRLGKLRSLHPTTFEEMILSSLQKQGFAIERNARYTGDGGIDGRFRLPSGQLVLIQAKRYRGSINTAHVRSFGELCRNAQAPGLFIHTGKTPAAARNTQGVNIISGQQLIEFLADPKSVIARLPWTHHSHARAAQ